MDETKELNDVLDHLVRLALDGETDEVRLYVARLVRRYRRTNPALSARFEKYLESQVSPRSMMRRVQSEDYSSRLPFDEDSRRSLLKVYDDDPNAVTPLFMPKLKNELEQLIKERQLAKKLIESGLTPARSAIFTGPPGVGKTLAARWIAAQLGLSLYVLDLTTVMSSLLGKTGANLRSVLDFARSTSCVLLLDEIDSIAKKRSDGYDVGELKRLVTIILQEIENWPTTSLLLAATNFPEMLDPALWRRFDAILEFPLPDEKQIMEAIVFFAGGEQKPITPWLSALPIILKGCSYSEIEREIARLRRAAVLSDSTPEKSIQFLIKNHVSSLSKTDKINIAKFLHNDLEISQRETNEVTGLSRDTIRKYSRKA